VTGSTFVGNMTEYYIVPTSTTNNVAQIITNISPQYACILQSA
jgi:hypothetical protein